ncbi:alpha/beta-hydrolase [Daedalea quercina L-15889]|uniref:Alpha/beta-hydrolase n=1 Tax=Daedalea quercina L-15889 TaxID=1314783 RepID=A0A165KUL4_9APHY|nr:alpha/beta-hydrolase [Daedalea quercina L-15889]
MRTATYSRVGPLEIKVDFQVPPSVKAGILPGLVFFHGGGMVAGSRTEYFEWASESALAKGMIFFTADYRLIHPSTGFDVVEDVRALFTFLADPSFSETYLPDGIFLDITRLAAMGVSGGGYPARAAALYAQPKPNAVFLLYAMGGSFLSDHWLSVKHPTASLVADNPIVASQNADRIYLFGYWWRTGELLDHVLGEPVSSKLRALPPAERLTAIPTRLFPALLEAQYDEFFPPTFLLHGDADTTVLPEESQTTFDRLRALGVTVEMEVVPGAPHGLFTSFSPLQFAPGAAEAQERGMTFLARYLLGST